MSKLPSLPSIDELVTTLERRVGELEATSPGGGGIDFNKDNSTDSGGNPADYLEIVTNGTGTGGSPPWGITIHNSVSSGDGGIEIVNDNDDNIHLINTGAGEIDIETLGGGVVHIASIGVGASLFFETNDSTTYGNIDFQAHGGGADISFNCEGQFLVQPDGDITLVSQFSGNVTITAAGSGNDMSLSAPQDVQIDAGAGDLKLQFGNNVILSTLPTSDPGVTGALWNNGGVVNVSP